MNNQTIEITAERIDDIPVVVEWLKQMEIAKFVTDGGQWTVDSTFWTLVRLRQSKIQIPKSIDNLQRNNTIIYLSATSGCI